jgi:hypothetical protein
MFLKEALVACAAEAAALQYKLSTVVRNAQARVLCHTIRSAYKIAMARRHFMFFRAQAFEGIRG